LWNQPDAYIRQMEIVCRMHTDYYDDLGSYLADHGRIDEAVRAYERALEVSRDEVGLSNSMFWLVRHYFEVSQRARAVEVAERVADSGSYWGLVTQASLFDWMGDQREAERIFRHAWKRYDNPNELLAFYLRHKWKGPELDELMHAVFPSGLDRIATPML